MKKNPKVYVLFGLTILGFIASCKHEFLSPPPAKEDNPIVTTVCSPDSVYFQQQVLPIFVSSCSMSGCHDAVSHESGIVLTSYSSIITSGEVKAGNPNESKVWAKIMDKDPSDRMPPPPSNPLTQDQKNIIYTWIAQGAKNNSCQSKDCDTTAVTYSLSIQPIIHNKCQGCHNNINASGGYDLSQYIGVKARVDDGKLWGAVNFLQGYSAMPKNGAKLSDCELTQISKWINAGAPNN